MCFPTRVFSRFVSDNREIQKKTHKTPTRKLFWSTLVNTMTITTTSPSTASSVKSNTIVLLSNVVLVKWMLFLLGFSVYTGVLVLLLVQSANLDQYHQRYALVLASLYIFSLSFVAFRYAPTLSPGLGFLSLFPVMIISAVYFSSFHASHQIGERLSSSRRMIL